MIQISYMLCVGAGGEITRFVPGLHSSSKSSQVLQRHTFSL